VCSAPTSGGMCRVATTAGTGIRLRLCCPAAEMYNGLSGPANDELAQQPAALHTGVTDAADIATVHCMSAPRHLRLHLNPGSQYSELFHKYGDSGPNPCFGLRCQLLSLRTLQLDVVPPEAFFTPGVAARLLRMQSLCLNTAGLSVFRQRCCSCPPWSASSS
jgi:hypothetical protein